ncbi:MAG: DegT/DnrJ/EryC1/StrS family aminotransferase, partial [Candidatus Omnitrophica bacterium]|nr:DegT/DnrJ/EryC1/StrS family aminotransferase [Candidatus Omnitrophota bacterium]
SLNQRRIDHAAFLSERLEGVPGLKLPKTMPERKHVFHLYPVLIDPTTFGMNKEDFIDRMLHEKGIKVGMHYIPLTWTTAFKNRGYDRGQFPVADHVGENVVTFPVGPRLTEEALEYLVESVVSLAG